MEHDLGAVGAPVAPSAVGLSFDAEAGVDLAVVPFAEQRGVCDASLICPPVAEVRAAAVYARISSDTEGRALGVTRQLEECRRLADQLGWSIAQEYVDNDLSAYSGKQRPGYRQMLADLADGLRDAGRGAMT